MALKLALVGGLLKAGGDVPVRKVRGWCKGGVRKVRGRCKGCVRKVRGRCKEGARKARGRCQESERKVLGPYRSLITDHSKKISETCPNTKILT